MKRAVNTSNKAMKRTASGPNKARKYLKGKEWETMDGETMEDLTMYHKHHVDKAIRLAYKEGFKLGQKIILSF